MAPRETDDKADTPVAVEKGIATLSDLRVGVKAFIEKNGEKRKAEILSIQQRKTGPSPKFYVHYEEFNKRLDEWILADRIDLSREVEWPVPEKIDKKKSSTTQSTRAPAVKAPVKDKNPKRSLQKQLERELSGTPEFVTAHALKTQRANVPAEARDVTNVTSESVKGTPKPEDEEMDVVDVQDAAIASKAQAPESYSREEEIEKLRTGGSMTQNQAEISRVRNLDKVQMGKHEMEPWYFSPYPPEFAEIDMMYICEFCLSYFGDPKQMQRHRLKCQLMHPPGNEIYRDDYVSFFEIDGRRQRTWCRNLCLLSKLFLDHKTLYYDVDPFLFYCMCTRDAYGCHLVGYFSKEKESAEGYNVACILTLPQYQRKGFGRLLIAFSYELSKHEGRLGSPEKPLSDLGLLGYRAYWQEIIMDMLIGENRTEACIEELGAAAAMTTNDVLHTLQNLNMIKMSKNQHVIVLTDGVIAQYEKQKEKEKIKGKRTIDASKLIWKPPTFTAAHRTWNW